MRAYNIRVMEDTKKEFESCGIYGDSADSILKRLVTFYKKYHDNEKKITEEELSLFQEIKKKE